MSKDIRSALTENLNELMRIKGIKAVDLAEKVGVSKSAVSHWLAGDNSPNIEILAKICQIYDVKLSELLNEKIEATYADKIFLKKYHSLDIYSKEVVDSVLEIEFKRCNEPKEEEKIIHLPKSVLKASAGSGNWLDEQQLESVSVLDTPQSRKANLVIEVDGDSMSPMYESGDNVLVNTKSDVAVGDIGIFIVDGSGYIKKLGTDRLISVNPEYDDIFPAEYSDFRCVGKVLGKAEIVE